MVELPIHIRIPTFPFPSCILYPFFLYIYIFPVLFVFCQNYFLNHSLIDLDATRKIWACLIKEEYAMLCEAMMEELPGAFGTSASLTLRLGQTVFSSVSLLFMCLDVGFYSYTAFCYLVTVMGLVIPWSTTLLLVDAYFVFIRYLPVQRRLIMIIILGDMFLSYLSLAAACSTASITDLLLEAGGSHCPTKLCGRYRFSAAMAFLSWFLSSASCLFNFWLLPSL